jgi:hypothetical protein
MRIFTRIGWGSMAAEQEPGPIRSTKTGSGRSQRSAGPVSGEPPGILIVGGGTELAAGTLVWTVGGTANPLASASDLPVDEAGRVRVTERLPVTGVPDAYAAGDSAVVPDLTQPGAICGPNAQHAARQAKTLAGQEMTEDVATGPDTMHARCTARTEGARNAAAGTLIGRS